MLESDREQGRQGVAAGRVGMIRINSSEEELITHRYMAMASLRLARTLLASQIPT